MMLGALVLVAVLVVVGPVLLFVAGSIWSALLGGVLDADRRAEEGAPVDA
jgi:hypothetical protein